MARALRFAWLPIPLLIAVIAVLWAADIPIVIEPPYLRLALNSIFGTAIAVWVAVLAARSFIQNGSGSVLLFGCGILVFGTISLVSALAFHFGHLNLGVTVYNAGACLSGAFHVLAAWVALSAGGWVIHHSRFTLLAAYTISLLAVVLLAYLALAGLTPPFYVEGYGSTWIRRTVVAAAIVLFVLAALMIASIARSRDWTFGRWYKLALALIAVGLFPILISTQALAATPLAWTGRVAQYLGGLYLLGAVIAAARGRCEWDAVTYTALRESQERLRALSAATFEGVAISRDGIITDVNEQLARLLGYAPRELVGRLLTDFIPKENRDQVRPSILSSTEESVAHSMMRKDGTRIDVESHGRTLAGHGGTMRFVAIRDISARKEQERALRESEEQLRALFENMSEGFAVGEPIFDANGAPIDIRFLMVNNAFSQQSSLTRDVLGKPLGTVLPYLERNWIETYSRVAITGHPARFEEFNNDTNRHYQVVCYSPAKGRFAILFNDVTDRKKTEETLRQAKEANERNLARLDAIVNHMTEGLVIFNPEGNLTEMNSAARAMHGFDKVDGIRKHIDKLPNTFELFDLEGNPLPTSQWPIGRVLRGESFKSLQVRIVRHDTGKNWIGSYGGAPVFDDQGNLIAALVTVRDVTEQRMAERALEQSRDELESRVRERTAELQSRADQLARLASELTLTEQRERQRLAQVLHDHLQQLLVGAQLGLDLLAKRTPAEQKNIVEEVQKLLMESIDTSRSLTVELSPPILHEAGLAAGLEWLARWMKEKHGLTVHLNLDHSLPVPREDVRVLVFQAIRELLFNVTKHARVTEATLELSRHNDRHFRAVVEDSGVGFDAPATFGDRTRLINGFGLFSIRERLDLLGGRLEVQSAAGHGARFTLYAPMQGNRAVPPADKPFPAAPPETQKTVPSSPSMQGKIRLLLVDDHAVLRQGLSLLLAAEEDLEIVGEAEDGLEALTLARDLRPDMILMDSSMPKMDGVEATRLIHNEFPRIQIIGLSMYEEADRAKSMLNAGAVCYLSKSGKSRTLLKTIRRLAEEAGAPASGRR